MSNYHIKHLEEYFQVYRKSVRNPEGFWEEVAEEHFQWRKKWDSVLEWDFSKPEISWFKGAQLNITENCIDRHLRIRGDKTAILFEPNDPNEEAEHITYRELHERVCKYANVLKDQGIKKGDRVVTNGGIVGVIKNIKGKDKNILEIDSSNTKLEVLRSHISTNKTN